MSGLDAVLSIKFTNASDYVENHIVRSYRVVVTNSVTQRSLNAIKAKTTIMCGT